MPNAIVITNLIFNSIIISNARKRKNRENKIKKEVDFIKKEVIAIQDFKNRLGDFINRHPDLQRTLWNISEKMPNLWYVLNLK